MSSDDYQVQNIHKYSRKTYKKNKRATRENCEQKDTNDQRDISPRSDVCSSVVEVPMCSCNAGPHDEIANILHKKCPVITLAQQQLQHLLNECDNTRCCRSLYEFLCLCKEVLTQSKCQCVLICMIAVAFFTGLLLGAASCGTHLRQFNSPLLDCIDTYFIPETYDKIEDTYRSIV